MNTLGNVARIVTLLLCFKAQHLEFIVGNYSIL